jgi:hypothetical protein
MWSLVLLAKAIASSEGGLLSPRSIGGIITGGIGGISTGGIDISISVDGVSEFFASIIDAADIIRVMASNIAINFLFILHSPFFIYIVFTKANDAFTTPPL